MTVDVECYGVVVSLRDYPTMAAVVAKTLRARPGRARSRCEHAIEVFKNFCGYYGERWPVVFADMNPDGTQKPPGPEARNWPMNPDEQSVGLRRRLAWLKTWKALEEPEGDQ